jgi:plastocyanin/heme-degrading monooxygenase HmoA
MEYIQTVLLQVESLRLDRASEPGGLLAELDDHRSHLKQQPGFRDLRITRSINPEGNVLIVIETRWGDDASLVRYETNEPNVAAIVNRHRDIIVSGSLQVLDMEALRTESSWQPAEAEQHAQQRVIWPILIPAGVLAFTLLVVYGLSRVYLEIRGDGAVALAAGVAIGVLVIAFFVASNRNLKGWHIASIVMLCAVVLFGATIWAVSEEDPSEAEEPAAGEPTQAPGGGGATEAPGGGATVVTIEDNFFEVGGVKNPALTAVAGKETTLDLTNAGKGSHNMSIVDTEFISDPGRVDGGEKATIAFTLDAGTYSYQCDFHPSEMKGELTVE